MSRADAYPNGMEPVSDAATAPAESRGPLARVLARSLRMDSLVYRIAYDLGSQIVEGKLAPGASISSVDVARRYHSSRAPVRDALLVLEREGLLTTSVGRASRVTRIPLKALRELYEIRAELYTFVAQRVVRYATDAQIANLRRINTQLVELAAAGDLESYFWMNLNFRDAEAHAADNQRLRELLDALGLQTLVTRHAGISHPGRLELSVRDHERLVSAYERRDEAAAMSVAREIVEESLAAMQRNKWNGLTP